MKRVEKRKASDQFKGHRREDVHVHNSTEKENGNDQRTEDSQMSVSRCNNEAVIEGLASDEHELDSDIVVEVGRHSPDLESAPHLRIPFDVDLFYRTPSCYRYSLRRKSKEDTTDYFKKFSIPAEVILTIFGYLNKKDLMMAILTCRRFRDIGYDASLWEYMDLGERSITESEIHSLMDRGIRVLRLTSTKLVEDMHPQLESTLLYPHALTSKLTHLDLSGVVPENPSAVAGILQRCTRLEAVSLGYRVIDDRVCIALGHNEDLEYLNLTMCQGLSSDGIKAILQGCRRLLELNMAWTGMDVEHVAIAIKLMPRGLQRLNLSGIRQKDCLVDEDIMQLIMRCPNLIEIDVSDAPSITERSLKAMLHNLRCLKDLSISRCYGIEPTALLLAKGLRTLNVFGNITHEGVNMLREHLNQVFINDSPFSTIAIPTYGEHVTSIWGHRTRDIY